jgi:dynein heavy chain, axonemal
LELLSKFSKIKDMQVDLDAKYQAVFAHYTRRDLEGVRKMYQKFKDNPPIPRNTPPVSGAISWARQLYRRIESPMREFKNNTDVLESIESKKHIRNYNKLARALIEFELLWYRSWYSVVDQAKTGLQATLLVSNQEGQVYVNFDPQIVQLVKETRNMQQMGLELPQSVRNVCMKEAYYNTLHSDISYILQTKQALLNRVTPMMRKALQPHTDELDRTIQPGLTALTW